MDAVGRGLGLTAHPTGKDYASNIETEKWLLASALIIWAKLAMDGGTIT
jgi:hypothetical protein